MKNALFPWFQQYLTQLKTEINAYQHPARMWEISGEISNSGGNLCTHLIGNLNYFIGAILGQTGYVRHRDLEFSIKNVPVAELSQQIDETLAMIETVFDQIEDWQAIYPPNDYHMAGPIDKQMMRLLVHLGYHVGQVNYHRRLLDH
jgi:hypothetical protein